MSPIARDAITGLVLAGGRGQRMQGRDKGLQLYRGQPLVQWALQRLAPQVGGLMLSANRHLDAYRSFGVPVWPDDLEGFAGPLAGWLAGLQQTTTPYLASVPCDTPHFPLDLVQRLGEAMAEARVEVAMAATPGRLQPVFSLLRRELAPSLQNYLAAGGRRVQEWIAGQAHATVLFDDAQAFRNFNTLDDLEEDSDA